MSTFRTLIWIALSIILVIFSMANWERVTITIWPGQSADTKLPVLIMLSFLLGLLPMWIAQRAARWSLKRRLDNSERQLADLRAMANRTSESPIASSSKSDLSAPPLDAI
jgi:lipopolysaccharide assembly protein A